jgi:capsular polysaccharide export protein
VSLFEGQSASTRSEVFPTVYACDFSAWKRPMVRQIFPGSRIVFVRTVSRVPAGAALAVWGYRPIPGTLADGVKLLRLEDGFLRSVGLGADLIRPLSWVIDGRGMYYDATRPSDLEHILATAEFSSALLNRAASLRDGISAGGLTKYNVGASAWRRPNGRTRVILVPGQVESDASLAFGAPGLRRNIELLRAVRTANPKAHVIYKPHPDVLAGLRAAGVGEDQASGDCDEQIFDVPMGDLLPQVDEVHVITSLTGFEALMRGIPVTCYGQPFYSGWGLTTDIMPLSRRARVLSIDQLVAGALILYPTYIDRATGRQSTPERAADELLRWRAESAGNVSWWRLLVRMVLRRVVGVR